MEVTNAFKRSPVIQALQLTALLVGESYDNRNSLTHPLSACDLDEFRFCRLGKHFCGTKRL
jgi:hypothetical protein